MSSYLTINDLSKFIENLWKMMDKYEHNLTISEYLTRYILIDPFLRSLGWDTTNPKEVWVDYRLGKGKRENKLDYALLNKGKIVAFMEAKSYSTCNPGARLQKALHQLRRYCKLGGVPLGILTDCGCWLVCDVNKSAPIEESIILEINFANEANEIAKKSRNINPSHIAGLGSSKAK